MATQLFLEAVLTDKGELGETLKFELGASTFYGGGPSLYLVVDGVSVVLEEEQARRLCEAFAAVAVYLGFRSKPPLN